MGYGAPMSSRESILPNSDSKASAEALADAQVTLDAQHYVYIVRCANGTLYAGYTTNVERRVTAHNAGRGARYTRGLLPVELLVTFAFETKSAALQAERRVKRLPRHKKIALIRAATKDPGSRSREEQSEVLALQAT